MKIKDYVNWFYTEKISWKDPTYVDRHSYQMLWLFYLWTLAFTLTSDLDSKSDMITVSNWKDISLTLFIEWWEVMIRRNNSTEVVSDADKLITALYRLQTNF